MTTDAALTLHQLFSPAFPVGAFAYSHGLETVVQAGQVRSAAEMQSWLEAVLRHGAGWSDAVLLAQAARGGDAEALSELGLALSPSAERRLEAEQQGRAFALTVSEVWGVAIPPAPYPVAVGLAVEALGLPLAEALRLYLQAFVSNLAGAAIRLIPLGQTEGQRIVTALAPLCASLAKQAETASLDEIGGFAPLIDIASQRHDMLYSRLFRS
ncbi:urease accessory protein UreF [Salipiger sp. P9]|uniref:urease accessory protein UreF n=1 Tax=Salipiger pentaromativorans TaxID=2943193 RepID=UPI0021580749|nr:urease accessory protein UreF [Salipiger pentaromativorans]MCR8550356.1 urease accessory protein UreF [Salipiger pentaromativorans]